MKVNCTKLFAALCHTVHTVEDVYEPANVHAQHCRDAVSHYSKTSSCPSTVPDIWAQDSNMTLCAGGYFLVLYFFFYFMMLMETIREHSVQITTVSSTPGVVERWAHRYPQTVCSLCVRSCNVCCCSSSALSVSTLLKLCERLNARLMAILYDGVNAELNVLYISM